MFIFSTGLDGETEKAKSVFWLQIKICTEEL